MHPIAGGVGPNITAASTTGVVGAWKGVPIMPNLPPYRCAEPGCGSPASPRREYCEEHLRDHIREHNAAPHRWVYRTTYWRDLRRRIIRAEPMCRARCGRRATDIDHVEPLRSILERGGNVYDTSLLAPLCASCHATKTLWEQGRIAMPAFVPDLRGIPIDP